MWRTRIVAFTHHVLRAVSDAPLGQFRGDPGGITARLPGFPHLAIATVWEKQRGHVLEIVGQPDPALVRLVGGAWRARPRRAAIRLLGDPAHDDLVDLEVRTRLKCRGFAKQDSRAPE